MRWLALCLLIVAACQAERAPTPDAPPVVVSASVASSQVPPGRPFTLTIEIDRQADATFELPDLGPRLEGLMVQDHRVEGPERIGERQLTRHLYDLKAPVSGTYLIPAIEAPWKTPADEVGTAGTGAILIEAGLTGGEDSAEQELRDLKPVAPPDPLLTPGLMASLAGAALVLVLIAGWLLRRRSADTVAPPPLPHEIARRELSALLRPTRLQDADQVGFSFALSATLRRYLEARFDFTAWRMPTPELLRALPPQLSADRQLETAIRQVLEASDEVKFSGRPVPADALESWVRQALGVVDATAHTDTPEETP